MNTFDPFRGDQSQRPLNQRRKEVTRILKADPRDPEHRGRLLYVQQHGSPAARTAAKALLDAYPASPRSLPKFDNPLKARRRPPVRRAASAADVQLLGLYGQRRDTLTDDEVRDVVRLADAITGDDALRLAKYVLEPARERLTAAEAVHNSGTATAEHAWLKARPTLPRAALAALNDELAEITAGEHQGLEAGQARRVAEQELQQLRTALDVQHQERVAAAAARAGIGSTATVVQFPHTSAVA